MYLLQKLLKGPLKKVGKSYTDVLKQLINEKKFPVWEVIVPATRLFLGIPIMVLEAHIKPGTEASTKRTRGQQDIAVEYEVCVHVYISNGFSVVFIDTRESSIIIRCKKT